MDRVEGLALDGATFVNGLSDHVHDTAQSARTHWDGDGALGVKYTLSSDQTISLVQSNGPDLGVTQMLGHLQD